MIFILWSKKEVTLPALLRSLSLLGNFQGSQWLCVYPWLCSVGLPHYALPRFLSWLFSSWGLPTRVLFPALNLFLCPFIGSSLSRRLVWEQGRVGKSYLASTSRWSSCGWAYTTSPVLSWQPPFTSYFSASCTVAKTSGSELGKRVPGFGFHICLFLDLCVVSLYLSASRIHYM